MISTVDRGDWLARSRRKPIPPYTVDEGLTFYCPQENLEAFDHPIIREYHKFIGEAYVPPFKGNRAILLILPCTRVKPYLLSPEHRAINRALLSWGFLPIGPGDCPRELRTAIPEKQPAQLLNNSLLKRGVLILHRMVVSEPMGLVPYEFVYHYRKGLSPASRYDDPGLFENRGNTVCPWRADCTGIKTDGRWRWGPNEREAYACVHNRLSEVIAHTLRRIRPKYLSIIAYVSPKLTHRSFITSETEKRANAIPIYRLGTTGRIKLIGVNDRCPGLVEIVPTPAQFTAIREQLGRRLKRADPALSQGKVRAYFASGGGRTTPLALPESLRVLRSSLERAAAGKGMTSPPSRGELS